MSPSRPRIRIALCAALVFASASAGARAEKLRTHFDTDSPGRPPGFFDLVVWGGAGEAEWLVLGDVNPPSTPNRVVQTRDARPAGSLAIALRRNYSFGDGDISVGLRRGSSQSGIVFRAAGDKDYLVFLVNGSTGEAKLSSRHGGKETALASAKVTIDREWSILSLTAKGDSIAVRWNGKPLFTATDPHPLTGRVGLATTGPGQASFDELVFDATAPTAASASP